MKKTQTGSVEQEVDILRQRLEQQEAELSASLTFLGRDRELEEANRALKLMCKNHVLDTIVKDQQLRKLRQELGFFKVIFLFISLSFALSWLFGHLLP